MMVLSEIRNNVSFFSHSFFGMAEEMSKRLRKRATGGWDDTLAFELN